VAVGPVCARRLAVVLVPPGRSGAADDLDGAWRLVVGLGLPGGDGAAAPLMARGTWRCEMPAKRSRPRFCLAA